MLKIKNQDFNLANFLGERTQTVDMIKENFNRIRKAYSSLKKGNISAAAKELGVVSVNTKKFNSRYLKNQSRAISNGWLELQYGWLPLLSDIYGAVKFLKQDFQKDRLLRVSAEEKFTNSDVRRSIETDRTTTTTNKYEINVKTCIYYRQNSATLSTLSSLGITNPLSLAWELTKYSFVVDWAVSVSNFLSTLDAGFGYSFYAGCKTKGVRSSSIKETSFNGQTIGAQKKEGLYTETDENFQLNRDPLITFPILTLPAFRDPTSILHALNSIALLRQLR